MKWKLLVTFTLLIPALASASVGYFRFPAAHQQHLAFTAEGDLWIAPLSGGDATRLTSHATEEHSSVFSPDGQQLAFVANYDGVSEVYVIPITGGLAQRVTYENSRVRLHQWHATSGIVYSTDSRVGPTNSWVLKTVNPNRLQTTTIPLADAVEGQIDAGGNYIYFTQFGLQLSGDNANQYNGGARGEIWRFRLTGNSEAELLTSGHDASVRNPMIAANRLFFISNASGIDNLWSMELDGSNKTQITFFTDFAVKSPSLNNGEIIFQHGAALKSIDLATNSIAALTFNLRSDLPHLRERWIKEPLKYLSSARYTGKDRAVALTARGRVAIAHTSEQRLIEVATPPNARVRNAIISADGQWVYALSDQSGELEIWRYASDGSPNATQLTSDGSVFRWNLYPSPDGKYLVHDDKRGRVWILDLENGENRLITENGSGLTEITSVAWSSDSQRLAFTFPQQGKERTAILLYSVPESKHAIVTSNKYESFAPAFSNDGQWLYFLSNREFVATPTAPWGDRNMGPVFNRRTQIFALDLLGDSDFVFTPPNELAQQSTTTTTDQDNVEVSPPKASIKWEGLQSRLWQVPINAGNYSKLSANKDYLFWLERSADPRSEPTLKALALKPSAEAKTVTETVADYQLSLDGKTMLVRKSGANNANQFIVDAGDSFPKDTKTTKVQAKQWQLLIKPQQEWLQMFNDAWLMHRDSLFDANMRGLDWQATREKYLPLLQKVSDRHELNDVFAQMMAELNALHSQVRGGDLARDPNTPNAGALGAVFEQAASGLKISHIYRHDPEVPAQAAPLNKPGVDVRVGDVVTHINSIPVVTQAELLSALRNQAGKQVRLSLLRGKEPINQIVKPVTASQDFRLRYQDWVIGNATAVTQSDPSIGYLHLYAMGGNDIASFAREFYAQYEKPGLIIDVRRNRGGNVDAWILEKLLKRTWMFWETANGEQSTNMQQNFRGHLVVLADEFTYSDGETFTAGVKALELGPVIGKQTAGAGVWLSGRNRLVDNGIARVAEYPVFSLQGEWIVEGSGVKPDIEVINYPHATFNGKDAQLEAAIQYLQAKLAEAPIPTLKAKPLPETAEPARAF
ncbi:S41 family peptidase [Alteromonas flava]|uniref:S41 family peptidase n=1 Tax=Alteromonas flava TaxID=2048003 RepID=UPI000C290E73|nr:S41 family peptidase [Alteromonas flava]